MPTDCRLVPDEIIHDGTPEDEAEAEERAGIIEEGHGLRPGTVRTRARRQS